MIKSTWDDSHKTGEDIINDIKEAKRIIENETEKVIFDKMRLKFKKDIFEIGDIIKINFKIDGIIYKGNAKVINKLEDNTYEFIGIGEFEDLPKGVK